MDPATRGDPGLGVPDGEVLEAVGRLAIVARQLERALLEARVADGRRAAASALLRDGEAAIAAIARPGVHRVTVATLDGLPVIVTASFLDALVDRMRALFPWSGTARSGLRPEPGHLG